MKNLAALAFLAVVVSGCVPHGMSETNGLDRPDYDPTVTEKDVTWNEARVAKDPNGAIGWSQLSAAYLKRARLNDDNSYAVKAEEAARKSLSIRRSNNVNAAMRLAQSILEQHRFSEALGITEEAMRIAPTDTSTHELHAEILVELGKYDEAWAEFRHYNLASNMSGMALEARLLEVDGKPDAAAATLSEAANRADKNWDMAPEAKSWFHLKLGTVLWNEGKTADAVTEFKKGIDVNPRDFKSMGAIARIEAAQGNMGEAKDWALKSVAITPTVEVASLLEDIATTAGDRDGAATYSTLVDKVSHPDLYRFLQDPTQVAATTKPHTHDRLYAMYLADHDRNLADALVAAKKDASSRKDVYAYDTLAWVLHQMGNDTEAKPIMTMAQTRGTADAKMLFHAGMIDAGLGDVAGAEAELNRALSINPAFQYGQAEIARAELAKLKAGGAK